MWFNYDCPTGANRIAVIEDPTVGKLIASYGLLPIRLRINGREINASLCTNVNTHPEYQGKGLFVRIGKYALGREEEFATPVSLGMPNQRAYPGHMKVGWDVMCKLSFLEKHDCKSKPHRCQKIDQFDERFDRFQKHISERFSFIVVKDHRFMNWRFVHRPDQHYTSFVYEDQSDIRGYVVLKHFDDKDYRKSHILDIQAEDDDAMQELIAAAETFAEGRDELNMWTNPNNPYRQIFLAHGFYEKEGQDLLIIHFNYGEKEAVAEGSWWFCLGDNDVY
jgi:hypothetical protein